MGNLSEEYVTLECPSCGGEVKIDQASLDEHFVDLDNGSFVYMGTISQGNGATCQHCGKKFARKQQVSVKVDGSGTINTGGGAFIQGNIHTGGGDVVGRDQTSIHINGNVAGTTIVTGRGNTVIRKSG